MDTHKIRMILFLIISPLFLLLLSYQLTISFSSLTLQQQQTFEFLSHNQPLSLNYTAAEISHLEDVAMVMNGANIFVCVSGIIMLILLFYFRKDKEQLQKALRYGGITTVIFIAALLFAILIGFEGIFTLFHQIFFPQGNWQFAADSLLIQTFPLDFFVAMGRRIFLLAFIFGCMCIGAAYLLKRKMKIKN